MYISEIIEKIKAYHKGEINGIKIDDATSRDKILYGNPEKECTGIITTCWATIDVIKETIKKGANLIIVHEALFWNHGDHTDWLKEEKNSTFEEKKNLLEKGGIVVWRNHDYIHSGIPLGDDRYTDGIFYGLANKLDWIDYISKDKKNPLYFEIPEISVKELSEYLINKLNLNGVRIIGGLNSKVKKVRIPFHVMGDANDLITEADKENIHCFLTLEIVDFTLAEYIRDSSMAGQNKSIISMGHFNLEESGMEYMIEYLERLLEGKIPCWFIQSGDNYEYISKK